MSRARGRKQEEKQQFLEDFPEAIEHDTQLSVMQNPGSGLFDIAVAGDKGMLVNYESDVDSRQPQITLLNDLDTKEIDFDFLDGGEDAFLTLTEYGMGILGEDESVLKNNGDLRKDAKDIREGELLDVDLRGLLFEGFSIQVKEEVEEVEEEDPGITGVNIEFTVLNNKSGTVELFIQEELTNDDNEDPGAGQLITFDVGQGNKGLMDNIGLVAMEGDIFTGFQFSVSGDVQVALTGIDFSTNYDGIVDPT